MSFEKIVKKLIGDTPGKSTEFSYFRIGPENAEKKFIYKPLYMQTSSREF